jgi:3-hydroxybutyryl-CoA dehydrogenase
MKIRREGVIGAGVMGIGIAQNLAERGHQVTLIDISDEILQKAESQIYNNIRQARMLGRSNNGETISDIMARITFTVEYDPLHDVDLVVENIVEKPDVKQNVYMRLDDVCLEACIFAANTSAIPITRIGSWTKRPDRVIGMHFMNPAPMKSMVEVIRGYHTSEKTIESAKDFLTSIGKECIIVNDSPGFVSNRVLMLTVNEAAYLLYEQVASSAEIDEIFRSCFGHKMGPLETADLIGLDTVLDSIEVLHESFHDSKYRPCPLLKKMVDAGLLGRKSGKGFFVY